MLQRAAQAPCRAGRLSSNVRPHKLTLSELIPALRESSSDPLVLWLIQLLEEWRADASTTEDMRQSVERYFGNSWISSDPEHKQVYSLWSAFRDQCIAGRGGMTINERLFCFDLLQAWDEAPNEDARAVVRRKVDSASTLAR